MSTSQTNTLNSNLQDVPSEASFRLQPSQMNGTTEFSPALVEVSDALRRNLPTSRGVEKFLNTIEDGVNSTRADQTVLNTVMVPVKAFVDTAGIASAIEKGVNGFLEGMPQLMKALDEVAKIHPFIAVAVLAFKAAYTLESKRRDNDKKILSLHVEMRDMMAVLVQLRDVKDVDQVGPNGESIRGRLQQLSETTAQDIKSCALTCDTYLKKKLVVKIFSGPTWEGKLVGFVDCFIKRRQEFEFALSIHTALGVGEANMKLVSVDSNTQAIKQKIDVLLDLFKQFASPEQLEMESFIESRGGKSALRDDATVKELIAREAKLSIRGTENRRHQVSTLFNDENAQLRREIGEDPEHAIRMNEELFDRKFEIQQRQIEEEIARTVSREGDRIISAVRSGPHDRLIDPDIRDFWKDMNWRGTVKARNFILVLRDHFQEKAANEDGAPNPDSWALEHINLDRVHSMQEAFDEDTSGFVNIQEVNHLTQLRPHDWSLPRWVAYWAIGWQMTSTDYCKKINKILAAMFHLVDKVKPVNRRAVNQYLRDIWHTVTTLTLSIGMLDKGSDLDSLRAKFEPWVTAEEGRLRTRLEDLRYRIDSDNTLSLITGPGRIETFIYPLLYLILNRHLSVISLGQQHVLRKEELSDAASAVWSINSALWFRVRHMRTLFQQRRLDTKVQFKNFACGMFALWDETEPDTIDSYTKLNNLPDIGEVDEDVLPKEEDLDVEKTLNYPLDERTIDCSAYDLIIIRPQGQRAVSDAFLGTWYGATYCPDDFTFGTTITFEKDDTGDENAVNATLQEYIGGSSWTVKVVGHTTIEEDGTASVHIEISQRSDWIHTWVDGKLNEEEGSIRGERRWGDDVGFGEVVFKRSPELMRFYPGPLIIKENPARARWKFALDAVRYRVKKDLWSTSFFMDRLRNRKRYIELAIRRFHYGRDLEASLTDELTRLQTTLTVVDARFYMSLINYDLQTSNFHIGTVCDSCGCSLYNVRISCMDCRGNDSIDLCDNPACLITPIGLEKRADLEKPHSLGHEVFKMYTICLRRYRAAKERKAKEALKKARNLLDKEAIKTDSESSSDEKPGPACSYCKKRVFLLPSCWSCTECEELFICDDCDSNGLKLFTRDYCKIKGLTLNEEHNSAHAIVRCKPAAEEMTTEQRLVALEQRFVTWEERFTTWEERLVALEDRLSLRMEKLQNAFQGNAVGPSTA